MSENIVSDTSATYALAAFAKKKKKKRVCVPEEVQESDSSIHLYDVVEMTKTSITSPEKKLEYRHDSTDLANNEISMYEEPAPSSTSYLSVELSSQDKDKSKSEGSGRARRLVYWVLVVVVLVLVAAAIACSVFTLVEVSAIKSDMKSLQQHINMTSMNRSHTFASMFQSLNMLFKASLSQVNHTLLNLLLLQENNTQELIYNLKNSGLLITFPAASCASVLLFAPSLPSGYYWIRSSNGSAVRVYCDMTRSCGNITGGWMRVAELDMTDTAIQCPSSLRLRTSPRRTCVARRSSSATCSSVTFTVGGVGYSKVCGRIKGYQKGTPDAFRRTSSPLNIESNYVDGVSLTHGTSPRQHIWTFVGAISEINKHPQFKCSCTNTDISSMVPPPPSYVGNDYFCDTAAERTVDISIFYADDPLWDGAGCGPQNTCCSFNNPPWFYKQLPQNTTDDIEMRVCRDEGNSDEDIAIEVVEIYVQ